MNIQKSRFTAMLTAMLIVCMMATLLVVPASAAVVERELMTITIEPTETLWNQLHAELCSCDDFFPEDVDIESLEAYIDVDFNLYLTLEFVENFQDYCGDGDYDLSARTIWNCAENGITLYETKVKAESGSFEAGSIGYIFASGRSDSISDVVTPELFNSTLDEIVTLLPVVIPVMIGFIGLRKGISFLQSVLHSA